MGDKVVNHRSIQRVLLFGFVISTINLVLMSPNYNGVLLVEGAISKDVMGIVGKINKNGPHVGIVVPNTFEMNPLLLSPSFVPDPKFPFLDFSGRRFRVGKVKNTKVIIVMTGLSMLNAGIATELLLSFFDIEGIVHYGIAGNANPMLQIGDVTIPQFWAHTGLWNWQRYGDGPKDELALEANGDYTREIGYLNFSSYNVGPKSSKSSSLDSQVNNLLNKVWYQPEEIFSVNATPEIRQHAFWVPVDHRYFQLAQQLEGMTLESCVNSTTCLPRRPKVTRPKNGVSASIFVDNAAYRKFLNLKFNATPIDMESASVALVSLQHQTPFIAIRSLSDLAGGGSSLSNEASLFGSLAAQNAVIVLVKFLSLL